MDEKDTNAKTKNVKIILLGESGVGKTSIISRYYMDKFDPEQPSTLGSAFITKKITKNKIDYRLNIWDTTGQEKYHSVTKLFVQGANIVILVYAVDQIETFNKLEYWVQTVKDNCDENVILAIAGNKYDLAYQDDYNNDNNKKIVSDEDAERYAKEKNAFFKITSAKNDKKGIDHLFENLLDEYIKKVSGYNNTEKKEKNNQLDKKKVKKKEKKSNCCQN